MKIFQIGSHPETSEKNSNFGCVYYLVAGFYRLIFVEFLYPYSEWYFSVFLLLVTVFWVVYISFVNWSFPFSSTMLWNSLSSIKCVSFLKEFLRIPLWMLLSPVEFIFGRRDRLSLTNSSLPFFFNTYLAHILLFTSQDTLFTSLHVEYFAGLVWDLHWRCPLLMGSHQFTNLHHFGCCSLFLSVGVRYFLVSLEMGSMFPRWCLCLVLGHSMKCPKVWSNQVTSLEIKYRLLWTELRSQISMLKP